MERRAKVELFEQIRREYEFGVGTVLGGGAQAGSSSADGAPGAGECPATGAQAGRARAAGNRAAGCRSSTRSWKPTAKRRASSVTPHIASGSGFGRRCRSGKWRR